MRSVPSGSFARLTDLGALWRAWRLCRRGKRRRAAVAAFELDVDRELARLHRELRSGGYAPSPWRLRFIRDPKPRLIAAPAVRDRVLHHALLSEIGQVYERAFIHHSYAAGTGRGPHRAVLQYLTWLRRYEYRLHLDDFVLFSDDQSHLESARSLLEEWLAENRGLALNPKHQMVLPNRAPGVFLGYRVSRSGISPSRKLRRRMKRRLILAAEVGDEALVRSIRSYRGLLCFPGV